MEIRTDIFRIKIALFSQAAIKIYSRFSTQETDEIHVRLRQVILISRQESMNMRLSVNKTFSRCVLCKMHLNISIGLVAYEGSWHFTLLVFFSLRRFFGGLLHRFSESSVPGVLNGATFEREMKLWMICVFELVLKGPLSSLFCTCTKSVGGPLKSKWLWKKNWWDTFQK